MRRFSISTKSTISNSFKKMDTFLANDTIAGCDRWKLIDLGMIQTLLHALWRNISVKTSATVSILTTVLISLCDTISDFSIAIARDGSPWGRVGAAPPQCSCCGGENG